MLAGALRSLVQPTAVSAPDGWLCNQVQPTPYLGSCVYQQVLRSSPAWLVPNPAHINADECCRIAWPGLPPITAPMHPRRNCSLVREFPKFCSQLHFTCASPGIALTCAGGSCSLAPSDYLPAKTPTSVRWVPMKEVSGPACFSQSPALHIDP